MNNWILTSKKRSKKPSIIWPEGKFTVKQIENQLNNNLSTVAIQLRINQAVKDGILHLLKETLPTKGKPARLYTVSSSQPTGAVSSSQPTSYQ